MRSKTEILEDVRNHPEVDEFRYEYADVIEAKDEVYASYVRERVKWTSYPKGNRPLTSRSEDLEARIAAPLLRYCYDATFDRGFVNEFTIDPFVFIDRGHELLDQAPVQKVIFSPKPVPQDVEVPFHRSIVPSPLPELMACPLLDRLTAIEFTMTKYQRWATNAADLEAVLASPHLSRILLLTLPEWFWTTFTEQQSHEYWARAFSRAEFRKMLTLKLPGYPGEGIRKFDEGDFGIQEVTPMPEEGRAFEREHGYLPCLHLAEKWGSSQLGLLYDNEIILAAQRGELPRFPVGAPVTDEMYAPPPRKQTQNLFHW